MSKTNRPAPSFSEIIAEALELATELGESLEDAALMVEGWSGGVITSDRALLALRKASRAASKRAA